jgi:ABC-type nitrate/sulfonate/bicarbonate transport system substrate-binding protein
MIADVMLFAMPPALVLKQVDAVQIADGVIAEMAAEAKEQGTTLVRSGIDGPLEIKVDPVQLTVALRAVVLNSLQALQAGQIAATTVAIPLNYLAEELGFNVIGRLVDAVPDYEQTAIATKRSWAEKNRAIAVRFMKAIALTHRWMYDNKEAAVEFLAKEMQLKPDYARRGWEYYTRNKIWDPNGDLSLKGTEYAIRIYMDQVGAKGPLTSLAKYVDQTFLADAVKELPRRP